MSWVLVPPLSKSDAQRALVLARLSGRELQWSEPLPDDVQTLRRGLAQLRPGADTEIDCGEGGAPFRFLLTQAALTPGARVQFTGTPRLGQRPVKPLLEALMRAIDGLVIESGSPWPLTVRAPTAPRVAGFEVSGELSSQFASSLLLGAAAMAPSSVTLQGALSSAGYLDLTVAWLRRCGWPVEREGRVLTVLPRQPVERWPEVPGDWSSIGYLLLLAWANGGRVSRVDPDADHPDRELVRVIAEAGLRCTGDGRCEGELRQGLRASALVCPDAIPTLAALACVAPGASRFEHVQILRHKESDRLDGVMDLVRLVGGEASLEGDALTVTPPPIARGGRYHCRGDHRLAMSAAVLSVLAKVPIEVDTPRCVAKSFPGFWQQLALAAPGTST